MKLFVTTNGRLYKDAAGRYYTPIIYGFEFFQRYLEIFDSIVLAAHCEEWDRHLVGKMNRVDGPGIEIAEVPFPHGKIDYLRKSRAIGKALKCAAERCDAAILRIPDELAFRAFRFFHTCRKPVAVEVTSDPIHLFQRGEYKKNFRLMMKYLWYYRQKYLCAHADGISYVTEYELQKRYPGKKGTAVKLPAFTAWYTDAEVSAVTHQVKRSWPSEAGEWRLLHAAANIEGSAKGHKELLLALNILISEGYNVKLTVIGAGVINEENREIALRYGLYQYINFTGILPHDEVIRQMQTADLLVYPSYCEGLPRVVVEAMSCGLPCILSDIPAHRAMLGGDYLSKKYDYRDLAEKVKQLICCEDKYVNACDDVLRAVTKYDINLVRPRRSEFYQKLRFLASAGRRD